MTTMNNNRPALAAFINSDKNKELNSKPEFMLLQSGYANGYVAIPPSHSDYRKNLMDNETIIVHGGVTFCESFMTCKKKFKSIEFIEKHSEITSDWLVIGFDTCHCYDSLDSCPKQYVIEQTLSLKSQLEVRWK